MNVQIEAEWWQIAIALFNTVALGINVAWLLKNMRNGRL